MAFKSLGLPTDLQISVPSKRDTNWADQLESDAWLKIVQHDHTGESGRGRQITTAAIANNAITPEKLQTNSVSTDKVQNLAITTAKLADLSVTTSKINDLAITGPKLADNAVDDTKVRLRNNQYLKGRNAANNADVDIIRVNGLDQIEFAGDVAPADNSISTAKLQDNSVTNDKLASKVVYSINVSGASTTSASFQERAAIEITTSGRPLIFTLVPASTEAAITVEGLSSSAPRALIQITANSTNIYSIDIGTNTSNGQLRLPPSSVSHLEVLTAGTYTVALNIRAVTASNTVIAVVNSKLLIYEL